MLTEQRTKTSPSEIALNLVGHRAREIAGTLKYLLDRDFLKIENLTGQVVDVGTGTGAGIVAIEMFGARRVIGVDHIEKHGGFKPKDIFREQFVYEPAGAARFLKSRKPGSLSLVTAFLANISLDEFFPEAVRALDLGGQILVTTDAPESVGYLRGAAIGPESWRRILPRDFIVADPELFWQKKLGFQFANRPALDQFFYIDTKKGKP